MNLLKTIRQKLSSAFIPKQAQPKPTITVTAEVEMALPEESIQVALPEESTEMLSHDRLDRIEGAILGQAIGDAIGHPVEFNHNFGKKVYGLGPQNRFTDDTQMMVAIAHALLAASPSNGISGFMEALSKEFIGFVDHPFGGGHRSPGGACMSGCRNLSHVGWRESGGLAAKGNGSAMRSSVIGAYYHDDIEMAWQIGCLSSVPTHNNLEPILAAGTVAALVSALIQRKSMAEAMALVLHFIEDWENTVPEWPHSVKIGKGYSEQNPWYVAARFGTAFSLGKAGLDRQFYEWNGDDFATVPATAAAIYYNSAYGNYQDVVLKCAANTADADTTTAIAGAMAGARLGARRIPSDWRKLVEQSEYLRTLARRLYNASQESIPATEENAS